MTIRKPFPKNHEIFFNDNTLTRSLKALEDRIEQSYLVDELTQSLVAISELIEPEPVPSKDIGHLSPEFPSCLELLLRDVPEPTQFVKDRDTIWDLVSRYGKSTVLLFVSPKLRMNLEVLYAGIVVSYIRMFNGSTKRTQLDYKLVFSGLDDLKRMHEKIDELRDKQYAHNGLSVGRHHIGYRVDINGNITIDADGPQNSRQNHLEMCNDLLQCLSKVRSYLRDDIAKKSDKIIGKLSNSQKEFLRTPTE